MSAARRCRLWQMSGRPPPRLASSLCSVASHMHSKSNLQAAPRCRADQTGCRLRPFWMDHTLISLLEPSNSMWEHPQAPAHDCRCPAGRCARLTPAKGHILCCCRAAAEYCYQAKQPCRQGRSGGTLSINAHATARYAHHWPAPYQQLDGVCVPPFNP